MVLREKASLADQVVKMEEEVRCLDDHAGVLSLENTRMSERTTELEVDLVTEGTAKGELEKDVSWILIKGLSKVVD